MDVLLHNLIECEYKTHSERKNCMLTLGLEPMLKSIAITRQRARLPSGAANNHPFATSIRGIRASKPHASEN
jgi:hypothetical protein